MITQTPAEGILLHKDYGDTKFYTVTCDCMSTDHTHHLHIEADDTGITITTYTQQKTNWWSKTRWHAMWTLLTKGYIEYEASLCMSEQQSLNYAETIKRAIIDVKEFRNSRNQKSESTKLKR